jgi:serine phosphatase RsbU (regulator of sigma subunit)
MELQIAVSKIGKYATSSSGDTVEVVERPNGGLSIVMADGQSSGRGAKWISTMVVRKVISLLAEGVRDGAAARAASDSLFTERKGKVSATLNILSIDMQTQTLVITRNNPAPALLVCDDVLNELNEPSLPVGLYRDTRPQIFETKLIAGLTAVAYTDGLVHAGSRNSNSLDVTNEVVRLLQTSNQSPQIIADSLLARSLELDEGRPVDDTSIAVLRVQEKAPDGVRRMVVTIPLEPVYSLF